MYCIRSVNTDVCHSSVWTFVKANGSTAYSEKKEKKMKTKYKIPRK